MASEVEQAAKRRWNRSHPKEYKRRPVPVAYDCRKGVHRYAAIDRQPGCTVYQCMDCGETRAAERRDHAA